LSAVASSFASPSSAQAHRLVLAGMAGNVLEWYDFSVYGCFAPTIAKTFFPAHNPATSLLEAFAVFAVGFLMRPVGGLLLGYLGDRAGRERALIVSVLAMALPTCAMGLLPSYQRWGLTAAVLMVAMRLIQGLAVGGEYTTSVVFMIERCAQHRRGLIGAFGSAGAFVGIFLGSAVSALLAWLMPAELARYSWRAAFLTGIVVGLIGYWLRRDYRAAPSGAPALGAILRRHWPGMLQIAAFKALDAVGFYLAFIYGVTYLTQFCGLAHGSALAINTLGMALLFMVLPAAGALSDWSGRKPLLLGSALLALLLARPLFGLFRLGGFTAPLLAQLGFAVIMGTFDGVSPAAMAEAFPASVRCSAVAISHNLCMAILGGTAPMAATFLIARSGSALIPAWYLMGAALLSAGFTLSLRESAFRPLPP